MDVIQLFESGSTVALAIVVWYEVRAVRASLETLSQRITDLFASDLESRASIGLRLGETMGRIDVRLAEVVSLAKQDNEREIARDAATGSGTSHPPARPEDYR